MTMINAYDSAQAEAQKLAHGHAHGHPHSHAEDAAAQVAAGAAAAQKPAAASDEAAEAEDGITPNHINMVMEHTNCTRNEAIRALRESGDDMINAVMKISGS